MNSTGDIVRVGQVWQTDAPRRPRDPRNCLRGLVVIQGAPLRCSGVNCLHDDAEKVWTPSAEDWAALDA